MHLVVEVNPRWHQQGSHEKYQIGEEESRRRKLTCFLFPFTDIWTLKQGVRGSHLWVNSEVSALWCSRRILQLDGSTSCVQQSLRIEVDIDLTRRSTVCFRLTHLTCVLNIRLKAHGWSPVGNEDLILPARVAILFRPAMISTEIECSTRLSPELDR